MFTEHDLQELISYRSKHPILSVYLNTEPSAGSADAYKLRLRQMLKEYDEIAAEDMESIERFVEHEYDWSGRGLAIFSCTQDDFFRSFSLS